MNIENALYKFIIIIIIIRVSHSIKFVGTHLYTLVERECVPESSVSP